MKTITIALLLGMMFSLPSCKMCKNKDKTETTSTDAQNVVTSIIVQNGYTKPETSALTDILKTEINGDILTIEVSYSGGCEEHSFKLYFNGNYKKSLPPKVNFELEHDPKGDACRSIVQKTLKFDISKAKYTGGKEMMVSVEGSTEMKYTY